ncbi:MAG: hypothetical protein HY547_04830 [Elusimicrobia bacterium]|nr:hypothetical protein [Elusimicrobiota bacterium]
MKSPSCRRRPVSRTDWAPAFTGVTIKNSMDALTLSRWRMMANWWRLVRGNRWEMVKIVSVLLFGALLLGCLDWWFYRALAYVARVPSIGNLLMKKLFEIAFLSSFSLIALSAMVTSLSTHFGAADLPLLLSSPLHHLRIYFQKAFEAMIHASWMITLVLIPFLSVMMRLKELDAGFMVLAFLLFIPFAMSAAAVGIAFSSLFVAVFPRRKLTELLSVLGVLVFVLLYSGIRLTLPQRLMRPDEMEQVIQYVLYLESPAAPFLPSRWYVAGLYGYITGDKMRILESAGALGAFAIAGLGLLSFLGTRVLSLKKWLQVLEGSAPVHEKLGDANESGIPAGIGKAPLSRLFLMKELKFFLRDSQRFSNVSFILAVCAIYLVSIYKLPMDTPQLRNFLSFINLALGLFIVAALSLRFCFPQPSMELQYAWIILASPIRPREILGAKLIFNIGFLALIGVGIVCVSPVLLGTDLGLIPYYLAAALCAAVVMPFLAMAIGSAFPKIRFENIIQIETSFGGFLYAVSSLGFVGLTLAVFAWPIRYFFQARYMNYVMMGFDWMWIGVLSGVYGVICCSICWFCWRWSQRSWERFVF